jgi:hypothetical protein
VTLQDILSAAGQLDTEITALSPEAVELATVVVRIEELQRELARIRAAQGPLIPDQERDSSVSETSARGLEQVLENLLAAANSKRESS